METLPPSTDVVISVEESEKILKLIRRDWKWAAASDFLYKFNPMLHLDYLDLADVEHDLIHGTSETIMSVLLKVLHVLTSIRGLSQDTWEVYLRRLYARRVPENRVWGTEEEPIDWKDLGWENRLDVLYTLSEWLFQAPLKVRQAMKEDSDDGSWRTAPIGRDGKKNEYWHLGRDRLWIKRHVEKPEPEQRDLKRKRSMAKGVQNPSKRKAKDNGPAKSTSAKTKPKPKVAKKTKPKASSKPSKPSGVRTGSRLTRAVEGDGWQKVPEEWLQEPPASSSPQTQTTDVEALFDDDLTDLSEEDKDDGSKHEESSDSDLTDLEEESDKGDNKNDTDVRMEVDPQDDGEFVEFETICITISEWKDLAERFRSVRSHNERRLHRYITQVIVPEMEQWQEALEEKQKKDLKDMLRREQAAAAAAAAEARPKRSSRLAVLADDEKRHESQGSVDGESSDWGRGGRYSRTRRAAARGARWFAEHQDSLADTPDSQEGEQDAENKEQVDGEKVPRKKRNRSDQEDYHEEDSEEALPPEPQMNGLGRPRRAAAVKADLKRPQKVTRKRRARSESEEGNESDEPFFLNCEICKRSGWNQDDSQHLISCQDCGIWQHMVCHDRADKMEGRPKRNWGDERFLCSACLTKAQNKRPRRARKPKDAVVDEVVETQEIDDVIPSQATTAASQATFPISSQDTAEGSSAQLSSMDTGTSLQGSQAVTSYAAPAVVNGSQTHALHGASPLHDNSSRYQSLPPNPLWTSNQATQSHSLSQPYPPSISGYVPPSVGHINQQQSVPFNGLLTSTAPLMNGVYSPQHPVLQPNSTTSNPWPYGHVPGGIQPISPVHVQQQPIQHPIAYQFNQPPQ